MVANGMSQRRISISYYDISLTIIRWAASQRKARSEWIGTYCHTAALTKQRGGEK